MPKYEFKAFTQEGQSKGGVISAESKESALKILQSQGLLVTYLVELKASLILSFRKSGLRDIYIFTRQLSYLLKARTPLDESIKSLSETITNPAFRSVLIEIYNDLISGISFSQVLTRFPEIFNSYYIGMVKIGESVGILDEALVYLADHLNNQLRFRSKIIQALIYPIAVIILFLAILISLFYFVIPQIVQIFVENNIPLPFITKIFQSISSFLIDFGVFLAIIVIALIYYLNQYFRTKEGKLLLFKFFNDIPFFGQIIINIYLGQFLESFYYLVKGGVPIVEALEIVKSSIDHPLYELALEYIIEDVKKGKSLSESLSQFPDVFSSFIIEGMKTAEKTGQLTEITLTILNYYNETIENQIANLTEALQPMLIVLLGAGLGLLEASLLLPLLQLTKYVQTF